MRTLLLLLILLALTAPAHAFDLGNRAPYKPVDNSVYTQPTEPPRQAGNTIEEAIPITFPGTWTGTTVGYTNNYDEVCPYSGSTAPDVVYAVIPAEDFLVSIDFCYSYYDTKVYVYDEALNLVACNDDFYFGPPCFVYSSRLESVFMQAGMTYYIIIDGYGSAAGAYQMDVVGHEPCLVTFPPAGPGVQYEDEPPLVDGYEDAHNGGCNSPQFGYPFQQITSPVFCGVSGWYIGPNGGEYRDTDWFHIIIPASGVLEIHGDAEYPTYWFEKPRNCNDMSVIQSVVAGPCTEASMTINGPPGSLVWLVVLPLLSPGPVNEYNYILHLNLDEPVQTERHSWTNVKSLFY